MTKIKKCLMFRAAKDSWKLGLSKIAQLYQLGPKLSVGGASAKVFICFHGNHEPIRECACEIVFIEDHSDWLFEMLQIA